jgi:hypothetical protein
MIMLMLGGIRMPSVPPAANDPKKSGGLYLRFSMLGIETVPIVAAVATDDPEVAAKSALEATLVCIKPPGNQFTQRSRARNMSDAIPVRSRISPIRMNNGTATSTNSVLADHVISPNAGSSGMNENVSPRKIARMPKIAAT